jgi:type I restriction enzyme S subunit
VIVSTVRTYLRAIARIVHPEDNLIASTGFAVIRPRSTLSADFVGYMLSANYFIEQVIARSTGVSYPAINASELVAIPALLPPLAEQSAIATFLDRETAKIDALIAVQQRLIELLQEKRQAVISHAVTKGLNPDAPMKDSGIEWLGDVPEHWQVGRLAFYVTMLSGFAFPSQGFTDEESQWRLLRGINVGVGAIRWDDVVYWIRANDDDLDRYELRCGDLVIGMDRPLIADGMRVARLSENDVPALLLQRVVRLTPTPDLDPEYLQHLIASEMFVAHFSPETTGVSVPHISPDQIGAFVIPIPPIAEQRAIVARAAHKAGELEALKEEARRSTELLQERRSALISAAGTGDLDLRDLAGSEAA